jgi:hypothetical protein
MPPHLKEILTFGLKFKTTLPPQPQWEMPSPQSSPMQSPTVLELETHTMSSPV